MDDPPTGPSGGPDRPSDDVGQSGRDPRAGRPSERDPAQSGQGAGHRGTTGSSMDPVPSSRELVVDSVLSQPLQERMQGSGDQPIRLVIELRSAYPGGVREAAQRVRELVAEVAGPEAEVSDAGSYVATELTAEQIRELVRADTDVSSESTSDDSPGTPRASIYRIWPNFEIGALIHRTIVTTKCQAVHRSFGGLGQDIVWAVMDSGIDADHAHFTRHANLDLPQALQHRSFVAGTDDADATRDLAGHGTHVAGILAGEQIADDPDKPIVAATWFQDDRGNTRVNRIELPAIGGMAPRCKLLSCKVLRDDRTGDVAAVLAALDYIQELNDGGRNLQVHGVNLSVGYPFDPSWFAAGLTPICREVDRLVRSGVVVVVAAGNTGFGYALDPSGNRVRMGFDLSINDPGNADLAITVGSTSARPHSTGVSYFSSKGPTGDGRPKPDLVAPGERVVSAGSGTALEDARRTVPLATYVEDSGTSMAAPHVSGAAAALLSVHREFIGHPEDIKRVLMDTATDLGRAPAFQGRGVVDAMRAVQSV